MAAKSCPPAQKNIVIVTVAWTFLFDLGLYRILISKNKKIPTETRSFALRLMIPERVLFVKRYLMLRAATRKDKFNCLPFETDREGSSFAKAAEAPAK